MNKKEHISVFDKLFDDDNEVIPLGKLSIHVMHLPEHTLDHVGYMIGSNVFVCESIFLPEVGSARCDQLGGNATVADEKAHNKHVHDGVTEEQFVKWRRQRDDTLAEPRLIHQALQLDTIVPSPFICGIVIVLVKFECRYMSSLPIFHCHCWSI